MSADRKDEPPAQSLYKPDIQPSTVPETPQIEKVELEGTERSLERVQDRYPVIRSLEDYPSRVREDEPEAFEHATTEKVLLFRVAYLRLAIPLDRIRIVQRAEGIKPLPESPRHVVGLMELGPSEAIPVVDLAHSLGIRNTTEGGGEDSKRVQRMLESTGGVKEHVLVYNSDRGTVGFMIDRAEAVVEAATNPLPAALEGAEDSSLTGLARFENETAYLIDLERHVPKR
ncbi:MAG: hypothetical protein C4318_06060 [Acidimicrobiia bacterium]